MDKVDLHKKDDDAPVLVERPTEVIDEEGDGFDIK